MAQSRKPKLSRQAKAFWTRSGNDWMNDWIKSRPPQLIWKEIHFAEQYPYRQQILLDLANMIGDGLERFWWEWEFRIRPEWTVDLFRLRDELRIVWKERNAPTVNSILDTWLRWRPTRAHIKAYFESGVLSSTEIKYYNAFECDVETASLIPDYCGLRAMMIQGVFEHWPNFKFCANPDCKAPYFISKRKDQTVCDAEICKAEKQRQHALKWWNENRAKKTQKEAVSKTTKKGSKGNVTSKAR